MTCMEGSGIDLVSVGSQSIKDEGFTIRNIRRGLTVRTA